MTGLPAIPCNNAHRSHRCKRASFRYIKWRTSSSLISFFIIDPPSSFSFISLSPLLPLSHPKDPFIPLHSLRILYTQWSPQSCNSWWRSVSPSASSKLAPSTTTMAARALPSTTRYSSLLLLPLLLRFFVLHDCAFDMLCLSSMLNFFKSWH